MTVVVKIGGRAAEDTGRLKELCVEMSELSPKYRFILVHGGGAEVTAVSRALGMEAVFRNGVRQTSAQEMDVVDMVLSGKVNAQIVRLCRCCGVDAVGLSGSDGGICLGKRMTGMPADSRTGEVAAVNPRLLHLLLEQGFLPVVSPTSMDGAGNGLNINADDAAFAMARAVSAHALVFLSDIPGVLRGGMVVGRLTGGESRECIDAGEITGGMIPKVTASIQAISGGVSNVIIGQYDHAGALADLLEGRAGTRICS
jgi:acetylglutamate kinase